MMGYYYDGWSWLWMTGMMILFWGGLAALVIWAIRSFTRPSPPAGSDSAIEILRRRLASGEISQDEYEKTRKVLQG